MQRADEGYDIPLCYNVRHGLGSDFASSLDLMGIIHSHRVSSLVIVNRPQAMTAVMLKQQAPQPSPFPSAALPGRTGKRL